MMQRCINVFGLKEREKLLRDELYVMLMLMRSEGNEAVVDCDDPMTVIACTTDTDACPAACREAEDNTPSVVKAGDLAVSATASTDRKIIVGEDGAVSDTDTLTFKTSEEVTITKVTLERYGFSDGEVVSGVRLEDADGNIIAESKELNDKDQVTLSIKKDYRKVDGTYTAVIVVETEENTEGAAGGTMWFKVVDVQSTAENLNVENYKPYTYDLVVYNGTKVELSRFGNDKDYNYEAGEMYEVARFRVKANSSAVVINGFTLTNNFEWNKVDIEKNLDKVEVLANGEKVNVKYSVNKDDQLIISLADAYELGAKKNVSFVVNASLADFEDYTYGVQFELAANDLKATEKKTETRVTVEGADGTWAKHTFRGGKIKLVDAKIADAEAAQWSVGVVVAEWSIELWEAIRLNDFTVRASQDVIDAMTLVVPGDEFDGKDNKDGTFTFSKVVIEESGKIQLKVDLDEEIAKDIKEVTFTITAKSIDKSVIVGAKYEELKNQFVADKDVSGSIKLVTLKVQAAKASLENALSKTKAVEFLADRGDRKVVFDGTYTSKKGDVTLTSFWFEWVPATLREYLTLYVYVDDTEVGSVDTFTSTGSTSIETFSNVKVKKDGSVKVKVEAEISSDIEDNTYPTKATFDLYLQWEDADGNDAGKGSDSIAPISVKDSGSVTIPSEGSNIVKLNGSNETIAYFRVKPSNNAEGIYLDRLELTISGEAGEAEACTPSDAVEAYCENWEGLTQEQCVDVEAVPAVEAYCENWEGLTQEQCVDVEATDSAEAIDRTWHEAVPAVEAIDRTWHEAVPAVTCDDASSEGSSITADDIKVNIGDDKDVEVSSEGWLVYKPRTELPKEGVVVEVILKGEAEGLYTVTADVNDGSATKTFKREFLPAIVKVVKQTNRKSSTLWNIEIEAEDDVKVTNVDFLDRAGHSVLLSKKQNPNTNDTMTAPNLGDAQGILTISYEIDGVEKSISRNDYEDFFIIWDEDLMVFSSSN